MSNFYIEKNSDTNEVIYLEFDKLKGYDIKPKKQPVDAIEVNKIVFVSPTLTEKLIRKKIDHQLTKLLDKLNEIDSDDDPDEGVIKKSLMDAERLKLSIINNYVKYLGNTYQGLILKKIQIIINELRFKLYKIKDKNQEIILQETFKQESKKGKGR